MENKKGEIIVVPGSLDDLESIFRCKMISVGPVSYEYQKSPTGGGPESDKEFFKRQLMKQAYQMNCDGIYNYQVQEQSTSEEINRRTVWFTEGSASGIAARKVLGSELKKINTEESTLNQKTKQYPLVNEMFLSELLSNLNNRKINYWIICNPKNYIKEEINNDTTIEVTPPMKNQKEYNKILKRLKTFKPGDYFILWEPMKLRFISGIYKNINNLLQDENRSYLDCMPLILGDLDLVEAIKTITEPKYSEIETHQPIPYLLGGTQALDQRLMDAELARKKTDKFLNDLEHQGIVKLKKTDFYRILIEFLYKTGVHT